MLLERRKSILDVVKSDVAELQGVLGGQREVTNFDGFGDIGADLKPNKTPMSELRAQSPAAYRAGELTT
jgi:hypothetical protein